MFAALPRCPSTALYLWKTEPTNICKENPARTTPKTITICLSCLDSWTGLLKVSRERQHLGPQEKWLVSSPLSTPAKEISCSLSSLLPPFLLKTNLLNSSTASAWGHKLFWHQQLTQKCIWHSRHWITASQMAADWKGYKFSMCCLRNIFLQLQRRKRDLNREKKDESLQARKELGPQTILYLTHEEPIISQFLNWIKL